MNKIEFARLMNFPKEWIELDMFPDDLAGEMLRTYKSGDEEASEHDRNGAFHWWIRAVPDKEQLLKLAALTWLDPDQIMAADVRSYLMRCANSDEEVRSKIVSGS